MRSKFGNKRTLVGDKSFMSKGEAKRYEVLVQREQEGLIRDLKTQVSFPLVVNDVKIARYIADFTYEDATGYVVEDFKGVLTDVFKLKQKLMSACHSIAIKIVKVPSAD